MIDQSTETGQQVSSDATQWAYISGRISVLETQLLNRSFFEALARSKSIADAQSLLSKTPYRGFFPSNESIIDYSTNLDQAFTRTLEGVLKDAPPHIMRSYFHVSERYVYFRNLFIRLSGRNASVNELENTFSFLAENEDEQEAVARHREMVATRTAPQNDQPVARSLFLDSVLVMLKLKIVSLVEEEMVKNILRDTTILECWTAILRNRWNGTDAETIQKWFLVPPEYAEFVRNTAHLALTNPVPALHGHVSENIVNLFQGITPDILRQNIDILIRDAIRENVLGSRMITYGPEKVLAFYLALRIEIENLRLALAAVISGIESRTVIERFRREYA